MADKYELGLYNAQVVEALMCSSTGTDKDTGMEVEKPYLNIRVRLVSHQSKTGEVTELEAQPEVSFRKYLSGGSMEGKGLDISLKQVRSVGGTEFDAVGFDAFLEPANKKLEGRDVQVLCSANDRNPKYRNWEVYSPGSAAPKTPATKAVTSALNARLGIKPVVKAKPAAKPATAAVGAPEDFV
ncbi:hypothetical protein UFOVP785_47 [uncultured Caudovirales phage]|uniref:DUF669 domain-containing protein n=1 Tax=uncultured Caudovirales phage TaxID=2100421 RepID=A0A6J5NU72_9CAUD|nr:hypothetical protein UFOVP785_47 [uncultured Caudovirales phage]